jgi:hypothetical protein
MTVIVEAAGLKGARKAAILLTMRRGFDARACVDGALC